MWKSVATSIGVLFGAVAVLLSVATVRADDAAPALPTAVPIPQRARIDVKVTRVVKSIPTTLPAALVPKLMQNDVVSFTLKTYDLRDGGGVRDTRYHADVAFINGSGHYRFRYEDRDPAGTFAPFDAVYVGPTTPRVFTLDKYDPAIHGTPMFFIAPEDDAAGQIGAVRKEVRDNPSPPPFGRSVALGTQARHATWFTDFFNALAKNAIKLDGSGKSYVTSVLKQQFKVPQEDIDKCYKDNPTDTNERAHCLAQKMSAVESKDQTSAPTGDGSAQVAGLLASVVGNRTVLAPYLVALSEGFKLLTAGRTEGIPYEYMPSSLLWVPGQDTWSQADGAQYLVLPKAPFVRPKDDHKNHSDVVFFTLNALDDVPKPAISVDNPDKNEDRRSTSLCATSDATLPFRLSHTSPYLHDVALTVQDPGYEPQAVAPGTFANFPVPSKLDQWNRPAYDVVLHAEFGFDTLASKTLRVVLPKYPGTWTRADTFNAQTDAKGTILYRTNVAACVDHADLENADGAALRNLKPIRVDDDTVGFDVDLHGWKDGTAKLTVYRKPADASSPASSYKNEPLTIAIGVSAPAVSSPTAFLGDHEVALKGDRLVGAPTMALAGITFNRENQAQLPGGTACYVSTSTVPDVTHGTLYYQGGTKPFDITPAPQARPVLTLGDLIVISGKAAELTLPPGAVDADAPFGIHYDTQNAMSDATVRVRPAEAMRSACDGILDLRQGQQPSAQDMTLTRGTETNGTIRFERGAAPFMTTNAAQLQLQLAGTSGVPSKSDWSDLTLGGHAVRFVRLPQHVSVQCDGTGSCSITGDDLERISAARDPRAPAAVQPLACPNGPNQTCQVNRSASGAYELQLADQRTWVLWKPKPAG